LTADLVCEIPTEVAITIRDGAVLELNGHGVFGGDVGLLMEGRGAVARQGQVGGRNISIRVEGEGWHTVSGITTTGDPDSGIVVTSDHNRLIENEARGISWGIIVEGHHNALRQNLGGGQGGFQVLGDGNRLRQNQASEGTFDGYLVSGHRNWLVRNGALGTDTGFRIRSSGADNVLIGNVANRKEFFGIEVEGQGNTILHNTALESTTDLIDSHDDCDGNVWRRNTFLTSRAGTVAQPACIQ
jgi:parallel beta-helix repeat protein